MCIVICTGILLWLIFGICTGSLPVIATNAVTGNRDGHTDSENPIPLISRGNEVHSSKMHREVSCRIIQPDSGENPLKKQTGGSATLPPSI